MIPTSEGSFWYRAPGREPVLVCTRYLAPNGKAPVLTAAPWSGGLTPVSEMPGEWQEVEPCTV